MGSPIPSSRYDALYDWAGVTTQALVRERMDDDSVLLDVGAGWGKYRFLLPEYTMDACEIWEPYVKKDKLVHHYRKVIIKNIMDYKFDYYDGIIMGDVFEHLSREDGHKLLEYCKPRCKEVFIIVPYQYHQHMTDDNPYEEHLQPDLTPALMQELYPELSAYALNDLKGLYVWKSE